MRPQTPADVLYAHQHLYEALANPNPGIVRFYDDFFSAASQRVVRREKAIQMTWLSMLYPARSGMEFLQMLRRPLYASPTFHVASDIVHAVSGSYERSTREARLQRADLPVLDTGEVATTGFMWLDTPLFLTDASGARLGTRAFSWGLQSMPFPPDDEREGFDGDTDYEGIRLTSWCHVDDKDDFSDQVMAGVMVALDMPLSISHSQFVPFGHRIRARDRTMDVTPDDVTRWVHTLWMFMGTEIVSLARPDIPRHPVRRQAKRSMGSDLVRVVTLRRVRTAEGDKAGRAVDWSCRWVVQGHYRHLDSYAGHADPHHAVPDGEDREHCAICQVRITWVHPYVKGPDGLPLKPVPETVYRVMR